MYITGIEYRKKERNEFMKCCFCLHISNIHWLHWRFLDYSKKVFVNNDYLHAGEYMKDLQFELRRKF